MPSDWNPQVFPDWRWPGGPHLTVGVYRPRQSDEENLVATLHTLLGLGAVLKGVGTAQVPGEPVVSARDMKVRPISLSDLDAIVADPTQQIHQFYIEGYFDGSSVVSLSPMSDEAARTDRHPVSVFFNAWDFEMGDEDDQARIGDRARRLLLELARSPEVAYGAILGEGWWMYPPTELTDDDSSIYFGDFVLADWVAAEDRDLILAAFQGAYVEQLEFGTYISVSEWFNPCHLGLRAGGERGAEREALVRRVLVKNLT